MFLLIGCKNNFYVEAKFIGNSKWIYECIFATVADEILIQCIDVNECIKFCNKARDKHLKK
jgi:hypothetical protein